MLRYLTFIAPLLVKAPRKNPVGVLTGFFAMGVLVMLGSLAVLIGLWYFIAGAAWGGVDLAWLAVGVLLLLGALFAYFAVRTPVKEPEPLPYDVKTDPLSELLPDELTNDPVVAKVLKQINEHPMGAVAAAVAVGTLVGQEVFGGRNADSIVLKTK